MGHVRPPKAWIPDETTIQLAHCVVCARYAASSQGYVSKCACSRSSILPSTRLTTGMESISSLVTGSMEDLEVMAHQVFRDVLHAINLTEVDG